MKFLCLVFAVIFMSSSAFAAESILLERWYVSLLGGKESSFQLSSNAEFYYGSSPVGAKYSVSKKGVEDEPEYFVHLQNLIRSLVVPKKIHTYSCPSVAGIPDVHSDSFEKIFAYSETLKGGRIDLYDLTLDCNRRKLSKVTRDAAQELIDYMHIAQKVIIPYERF